MQQQELTPEYTLAQRLQLIEDRLILVSLPTLILCLILWAIASAFPVIALVIQLIVTIVVMLISCVVMIRLVEVARSWIAAVNSPNSNDMDMFYVFGIMGIGIMLLIGVWLIIDSILHAGNVSTSRTVLVVANFLVLLLQYRAIIRRYLGKPKGEDHEQA